jgi:hypothetical protein
MKWSSNEGILQTDKAGSGVTRLLRIRAGGGSQFTIDPSATPTFGFYGQSIGTPSFTLMRIGQSFTNTATSGTNLTVSILPTYNQASGTAANTDLLINRTQTAVGSGSQLLIDAQVGGVSRFNVYNSGQVNAAYLLVSSASLGVATNNGTIPLVLQNQNSATAGYTAVKMAIGTQTATSGTNSAVSILPTYNQVSGTAANTDLLINRTQTAVGSGSQYLIDAQVGGVSKFSVSNLGTVSDAIGDVRLIPQNSQSAAYTLVLTDAGKHILHPAADTTARIFTVPANGSVAYPIGTAITIINQNAAGVITIAITTDTMYLAGAGTTGSRTLAANGICTLIKITATIWIISGTGLT